MRRRPKPVVLPLRPVPQTYAANEARCPACGTDGATTVGVLAMRLVYQCPGCGAKFHRVSRVLV